MVTAEEGEFYLNLYSLVNDSLSLEDSLPINGSSALRTQFRCVESDTFVWAVFAASKPYTMTLFSYSINADGFLEEVNTVER